jgi:dipeptidyl aminopeptidase/acylaminoacyl peptidase
MWRRISVAFPLIALLSAAAPACGHFSSPATSPRRSLPAIALSVPADAVYLVDARTGQRRTIASRLSDFQGGYAAWAPDHRRLAYGDNAIVLFEPRSNRETKLIRGKGLSMPAWSRDQRTLVYGDGISLWTTRVERPKPHRFRIPAVLAPLEMDWSSTGLIAFEGLKLDCSRMIRCTSTGWSEIWTILSDGTGLTQLTHLGHVEKPKWSPDGQRVLFVRTYPASHGRSELWAAGADGSGTHRLLSARDVVAADWSPDGTRLAVVRRATKPRALQLWIGASGGRGLAAVGRPVRGTDATLDW